MVCLECQCFFEGEQVTRFGYHPDFKFARFLRMRHSLIGTRKADSIATDEDGATRYASISGSEHSCFSATCFLSHTQGWQGSGAHRDKHRPLRLFLAMFDIPSR